MKTKANDGRQIESCGLGVMNRLHLVQRTEAFLFDVVPTITTEVDGVSELRVIGQPSHPRFSGALTLAPPPREY